MPKGSKLRLAQIVFTAQSRRDAGDRIAKIAQMKLIGTDGKRFYAWELDPGKYIVGRKTDCDLFVNDITVSRRHAQIEVDSSTGTIRLTDLGSHNGTLVNNERLTDSIELQVNDRIIFGDIEFKLADQSDDRLPSGTAQAIARPSQVDHERSVVLSIDDALQSLPQKATEHPQLFSTLSEMARLLVLHEPREVMLQRSLELVARVITAERLAVLFTSDDLEEIYTAASILPDGKNPGDFSLSKTILREVLSDRNAILIGNPEEDSRFSSQQSIIMSKMKSALAVPLVDDDHVLGILYIDTTNPRHRYSDDHLRLAATFGNIIASRLANYELLSERQEKRLMESELRRASSIQKSMLVDTIPTVPCYSITAFQEQSRSVGGDLYDVALLPDNKLIFLVADVSGKGTGAALLMSNLLAAFRILYETPDCELCKVVTMVSRQMFRYTPPEMFATLFIGCIDYERHTMKYINAGHNPPLLTKADGTVISLEPSGTMIGAFDFGDWEESEVELRPGDLVVIFTDGVTEAENASDDQYGDERLEEFVIASRDETTDEISRRLIDDITKFTKGAPQSDDITLLLLKRER